MKSWKYIAALLALTLVAFGGYRVALSQAPDLIRGRIEKEFPTVPWISLADAEKAMGSKDVIILDVRETEEFEVSHLRGAERISPSAAVFPIANFERDKRYIVYCSVGYRSAALAAKMQKAGIEKVWNLDGGIFAWANSGRPIYAKGKRAKKVHPYDAFWGSVLKPELRPESSGR